MLLNLNIRNFILIEHADIPLSPGFTVVTGETGAGKSIFLAAIAFAMGAKSESSQVGLFAEEAYVTLEFTLSSPENGIKEETVQKNAERKITDLFTDAGIEGTEFVIRRTLSREGRSRVFLNDTAVSLGFLRQLAPFLGEFHGQFSQLWNTSDYSTLLDRFSGVDLQGVQQGFTLWSTAQKELVTLEKHAAQQAEEAAFLAQALLDFEYLCPEEGEESRLLEEKTQLKGKRATLEAIGQLRSLLGEGVQGAFRQVEKILGRESMPFFTDLRPHLETAWEAVDAILTPLESLERDLMRADRTLEDIEERLFALRDLARKHMVPPEMLVDLWRTLKERSEHSVETETALTKQKGRVAEYYQAYKAAASQVSAYRQEAAHRLNAAVNAHLNDVRLTGALFQAEVVPSATPGYHGQDVVTFLVRTNPQGPLRPLAQGGSGGELARFSLALYAVLAHSLGV
ncbi:MAG: AAA family ATPase, partial [Holosporales bacterium]|nr:AAA family ATPase [Holosporales bacterium]